MATDPFVHLHVASGYSLRYGATTPVGLVEQAAAWGQSMLALTDRDGLYGAVRFAIACQDAGIMPILGVDLAVRPSGLLPERPTPGGAGPQRRSPARGGAWVDQHHPRVVLLARGRRGWASLCRLVSAAHLSGERGEPVATFDQIAEHRDGLVLLLGPQSEVTRAITARRPDLATAVVERWRDVFDIHPEPSRSALVVEVVSHLVPDRDAAGRGSGRGHGADWVAGMSLAAAARLRGWAEESGLPTVLANCVRHATAEQARTADVLDAIRRLVPLSGRHLDRGNAEGYLKSGDAMAVVAEQILSGSADPVGEAQRWIQRTAELGRSCAMDPSEDMGLGSIRVPELSVVVPGAPDHCDAGAEAAASDRILRDRCEAGLIRKDYRGHDSGAAVRRLEAELGTISQLGFASYFLTVAEVTDLMKGMDVRVAARGSGAGSLVNHLLGISGVDPMAHGLIMERFLSPLRRALPDIDVDVESHRRTEVYERILERFSGERCTCVSMMDTYRVRHAVRDVGAALAMPPAEVDAFAKAFPHIRAKDARNALSDLPELRDSGLGRLAEQGRLDTFLDLVESLDGLPRHVALHPCGVLLSDRTLLDRTPVEASWLGFPMSQFDKDDVEEMGFLKLDVLGIRMQSAISHAISEISSTEGERVDIDAVPLDDAQTFELVQDARTLGCFQIESPGQRELVGKFAPQSFNDLIIDISLFRPGPVKSDMVSPFLRVRHGWADAEYLHETLRPVLEETAGVVVFHEQVIRIVVQLSGCSLAEADEVRRTMGSPEGQQRVWAWFYPTAMGNGYSLSEVESVWDVLKAFASFGFCKAHAAAFALPTYQSAWLKAHHPAAFYAGVLTHDPGMYPKRLILDDARHHGVQVHGLDVNSSDRVYRVVSEDEPAAGDGDEPDPVVRDEESGRGGVGAEAVRETGGFGIRLPLTELKGISEAEVASIIASRPYSGLADFWERSQATRPSTERLILVGAFDAIHRIGPAAMIGSTTVTRRDLLLQVGDLERYTRSLSRGGRTGRRGGRTARRPGPVRATELSWCDAVALRSGEGGEPVTWRGRISADVAAERAVGTRADTAVAARLQSRASRAVEDPAAVQLPFDLADAPLVATSSGLPEITEGERVRAEVEILGMDVTSHVVSFYEPMLQDLAVVRSTDLLNCRSRAQVLVAGVKVATQTPPVRSGRRVVFLTLDDATGPVDATFFEDAQGSYASTVFGSWMLLVRGHVRRTGPKGVSLRATGCWELSAVRDLWSTGGVDAVLRMLDASDPVVSRPGDGRGVDSRSDGPARSAENGDSGDHGQGRGAGGHAGGMGQPRRVLVHASGFRMSPYADIRPAGNDPKSGRPAQGSDSGSESGSGTGGSAKEPPAKLWHSSPGSSGW